MDDTNSNYSIYLDAIDMNTISKLYSDVDKDTTVPLWTAASSGLRMASPSKQYYEFEVFIEEAGDGDDKTLDNATCQRCYVCKLDVPTAYWGEHIMSEVHRACSTILESSVERARKMALYISTGVPREQTLTYFCQPCCRVIATAKQNTHETSEEHTEALQYTSLIKSLANLYENKDNFAKVREEIFEKDLVGNTNKTIHKRTDRPETGNFEKGIQNAIIYAKSGAKIKVPMDNYHGFYKFGDDKTLCRVCRTLIDDKFDHQWVTQHRKLVEADVMDKHCIRQLDHILNHCIICNEIIENMEEHISCSEIHETLLKDALLEDDKIDKAEDSYVKEVLQENLLVNTEYNNDNYYCNACHVYIMKSTYLDHISKQVHQVYLQSAKRKHNVHKVQTYRQKPGIESGYCSLCRIDLKNGGKKAVRRHERDKEHQYNVWLLEKDKKLHYHMKTSGVPKERFCKICLVLVSVENDGINKHVDSMEHQTKHKILLEDNLMEKVSDINIYCNICKVSMYMIHDLQHIEQTCHKKKVTRCQSLKFGVGDVKHLNEDIQNVDEHSKLKEQLEANKIYSYNEKIYQCKVCYRCFPKSDALSHIFSKKHTKTLLQVATAEKWQQNSTKNVEQPDRNNQMNQLDDTNNESSEKSSFKLLLQINQIEEEGDLYYRCRICSRAVMRSYILKHIDSERHKSLFGTFESYNIVQQPIKDETTPVAIENKDTHIESTDETLLTDTSNTIETPTNDQSQLVINKPRKKLHYLFDVTDINEEKEIKCLVCEINMTFVDVALHRKDKSHKELYKNLMDINTMFRIKNRCFCECCREIMQVNQEYIHLTSDIHRYNLTHNERMDEYALKTLSLEMFVEDIAATKRAKAKERYSRYDACCDDDVDTMSDRQESNVNKTYVSDDEDIFELAENDKAVAETQPKIEDTNSQKNVAEVNDSNKKTKPQNHRIIKNKELADLKEDEAKPKTDVVEGTNNEAKSQVEDSEEEIKAQNDLEDVKGANEETMPQKLEVDDDVVNVKGAEKEAKSQKLKVQDNQENVETHNDIVDLEDTNTEAKTQKEEVQVRDTRQEVESQKHKVEKDKEDVNLQQDEAKNDNEEAKAKYGVVEVDSTNKEAKSQKHAVEDNKREAEAQSDVEVEDTNIEDKSQNHEAEDNKEEVNLQKDEAKDNNEEAKAKNDVVEVEGANKEAKLQTHEVEDKNEEAKSQTCEVEDNNEEAKSQTCEVEDNDKEAKSQTCEVEDNDEEAKTKNDVVEVEDANKEAKLQKGDNNGEAEAQNDLVEVEGANKEAKLRKRDNNGEAEAQNLVVKGQEVNLQKEKVEDNNEEAKAKNDVVKVEGTTEDAKLQKCEVENNKEEADIHKDVVEVEIATEFTETVAHLFEITQNQKELLCIICNLCAVPNRSDLVIEHINGLKHTKQYEGMLLLNDMKEIVDITTEIVQKFNCKACGVLIDKSELFSHINSGKHKLYLTAQPSTSASSQQIFKVQTLSDDKILLHKQYLMIYHDTDDELFCRICDSEFLEADLSLHVNSRTHQSRFEYLLLENEIKKISDTFFCGLCKSGLAEDELEHIYKVNHKVNFTTYSLPISKNNKKNTVKANEGYICTTCKIELLNNPNIIKFHNNSVRHKHNLKAEKGKSSPPNVKFNVIKEQPPSTDIKLRYICKVCNVEVPNTPSNIKTHNDGNKHKNNLELLTKVPSTVAPILPLTAKKSKSQQLRVASIGVKMSKNETKTNVQPPTSTDTNPITKPNASKVNIQTTATPAIRNYIENGVCLVCNVSVPNVPNNIVGHLNGTAHNKKLQSLLLANKNKEISVQQAYNNPGASHDIVSNVKTNNIKTDAKMNVQPSTSTNTNPVTKTKANESIKQATVAPAIRNDVENGVCLVCNVKVPNGKNNITEHLKGSAHNKTLQSLLTASKNNEISVQQAYNNPGASHDIASNVKTNHMKDTKIPKTDAKMNVQPSTSTNTNPVTKTKANESIKQATVAPAIRNDVENGVCLVCNVKVPNGKNNITEHLKGSAHNKTLQSLLTASKNNEISVQQAYNNPDASHDIASNVKTNNMKDTKIPKTDAKMNVQPSTSIDTNSVTKTKANKSIKQATVAPAIRNDVENGVCLVCNVKVPNGKNNITEHLKGSAHNKTLQSLLTASKNNEISVQQAYNNPDASHDIASNVKTNNMKDTKIPKTDAKMNVQPSTSTNTNPVTKTKANESIKQATVAPAIRNDVENGVCLVCNVKVPNGKNNITEHLKGSAHNKTLQSLLTASKNNEISVQQAYNNPGASHDIASNVKTNNMKDTKIPKTDAKMNVQPSTSTDTNPVTKTKANESIKQATVAPAIRNDVENGVCLVCNVKVTNGKNNITEHLKGSAHNKTLQSLITASKNNEITDTKMNVQPSTSTNTNPVTKSKANKSIKQATVAPAIRNDVENGVCLVCNVKVPNGKNNITEHLKGSAHNKTLQSLLTASKNQEKSVHQTYNNIQNRPGASGASQNIASNVKAHNVENTNTKTTKIPKTNTKMNVQPSTSTDTNPVTKPKATISNIQTTTAPVIVNYVENGVCLVCNVSVPNVPNNIVDHLNGTAHNKTLQSLLTADIKYIDNGYCYLCKMWVPYDSSIKEHINGNAHRIQLSVKLKASKNKSLETQNLHEFAGTSKGYNAVNNAGAKSNVNYIEQGYCKLCNVQIPNNISNITEHVKGWFHQENLQLLESRVSNKTTDTETILPESQSFHECKVCKIKIPLTQNALANHFKDTDHLNNIEQLSIADQALFYTTEMFDELMRNEAMNTSEKNGNADSTMSQTLYECGTCKLKVTNTPGAIFSHFTSTSHQTDTLSREEKLLVSTAKAVIELTKRKNIAKQMNRENEVTNNGLPDVVKDNSNAETINLQADNSNSSNDNNKICDTAAQESKNKKKKKITAADMEVAKTSTNTNDNTDADENTDDKTIKTTNHEDTKNNNDNVDSFVSSDTSESYDISQISDTSKTAILVVNHENNTVDNAETSEDNMTDKNNDTNIENNESDVVAEDDDINIIDVIETSETNTAPNKDNNTKPAVSNSDDSNAVVEEGFYICSICNRTIPNDATEIQDHLNGLRHKTKEKEKRLKEQEGLLLTTEISFCDICKVEVPNNSIAAKKHNESERHKTRMEIVLKENRIKIRDDQNVCFCEVCDLYFSKFSISSHINKNKHKLLLNQNK